MIQGYRQLSDVEIALINRIKNKANEIEKLVNKLDSYASGIDKRWTAIGKTNLQQGFMALVRSVAQPEGF